MKHRDPVVTILLALFVPFYSLYWFYDTNIALRKRNIRMPSNFWLIAFPVFALVGWLLWIIVNFVLLGASSQGSDAVAGGAGILMALFGLLFVAAYVGGYVMSIVYFYRFSQGAVQVVGHDMSPGIYTLLMVLIAAIPIYLIQEKLNNVLMQEYYQQYPPQQQYQQPPTPPTA